MSNADASMHIYQRAVDGDRNDSLSIIASLIEPGQTLLDLGYSFFEDSSAAVMFTLW